MLLKRKQSKKQLIAKRIAALPTVADLARDRKGAAVREAERIIFGN